MAKKESETEMYQVLSPEGKADKKALKDLSEDLIHEMYRLMVLTRRWNSKALSLQRQGRMGTLASIRGQEAATVGMGFAMGPDDWFAPAFREYGAQFARGVKPVDLYRYWAGIEDGAKPPEDSKVLPICITVGSHLLHAAGIAMGAKIKGEKIAVLSSSGDGSTSQGDFHEALNFAGVFKLPVVFAIQNNHWAISVPVEKQTASETFGEKACAYGIKGEIVDGNDVFGVYLKVKELLDAARENHEPALVELVTYRMDDHTTSDDASRYRTEEMVEPWRDKDPIDRVRKYLIEQTDWDEKKDEELADECDKEVESYVKEFEDSPSPEPSEIFDHMYSWEPWHIAEEREELRKHLGKS